MVIDSRNMFIPILRSGVAYSIQVPNVVHFKQIHQGAALTKWKIKQYINVILDLIKLISIQVICLMKLLIVLTMLGSYNSSLSL